MGGLVGGWVGGCRLLAEGFRGARVLPSPFLFQCFVYFSSCLVRCLLFLMICLSSSRLRPPLTHTFTRYLYVLPPWIYLHLFLSLSLSLHLYLSLSLSLFPFPLPLSFSLSISLSLSLSLPLFASFCMTIFRVVLQSYVYMSTSLALVRQFLSMLCLFSCLVRCIP